MNQPLDNIFPYGIPLIIIRHPPQWLQVCVNPLYTKPRFRGVFNIRGTGSYQNYWWFKTQTEAYQQIIENSVTLQGIGNDFEQCQILSTLGWPQCTYIYKIILYIYIFVYTSYFLITTHQHQVSKVRPWPVRLATLGCCPGNPGNLLSGSSLVMTNSLP